MGKAGKKSPVSTPGAASPVATPLLARRGRFWLVVFAVTAVFCVVIGKLAYLQVIYAPKLRQEADDNRRSHRVIKADRGKIVDAKGSVLATTREVWDVIVDPSTFTPAHKARFDELAEQLSAIIGVPAKELLEVFKTETRPVRVRKDAPLDGEAPEDDTDANSPESAVADSGEFETRLRKIRWVKVAVGVDRAARDKVAALGVKSLYCERRFEREYPKGGLAAHLVGYVNKVGQPSMGIEKSFDFYLRGEDGWIDSQHNAKRQELADRRQREVTPCDGQKVELTIDGVIQQFAEAELERVGREMTPVSACIIVSEAKTGRLIALANYPTFNLNEYNDPKKAPMEAQKNHAVTDVYEPGSVFKIVSVAAGLQEGIVTPNSMIDCGLSAVPYRGKIPSLPGDSHRLGMVDLRHVVWQSSNRGTVQVGMRVAESKGEEALWKYMKDFGFGTRTGFVNGGESPGILHHPKNWDGLTITRLPMGHSVSVTAMQMHYAMGVVASGGDLYAPSLVRRVSDKADAAVLEFEPVVRRRQVISKQTATTLADMLRGVCTKDGTAKDAAIPGYDVAGKTGTTQKLINGHYSSSHHVASFSGFFPAGNPQIVVTVIVDEPKGQGTAYGGRISAPIFRKIAEKIIAEMNIPPANLAEYEAAQKKAGKAGAFRPVAPSVAPLFDLH